MIANQAPPHSYESEVQVIGSLMLNCHAFQQVSENLHIECFYDLRHKIIFNIILFLMNAGFEPDLQTVAYEIRNQGKLDKVDLKYLTDISIKVPTSANIEYYVAILNEMYVRREILRLSHSIERDGINQDAIELLDKYRKELDRITRFISKSNMKSLTVIANETYDTLQKYRDGEIKPLKTGIFKVDEIIGGLYNGDLIIIAARTSVGKTAFALTIAKTISRYEPVGFISLEMTAYQTLLRLASIELEIDGVKLRDGDLNDEENGRVIDFLGRFSKGQFYIDEVSGLTEVGLRERVNKLVDKYGVKIIFVDYIGLMRSAEKTESRTKEVGRISNYCAKLAKEVNIPLVMISQLNRSVESRSGHEPMLSDLRDAGDIEQDADLVILIDRPEVRGEEHFENGGDSKGRALVKVAKNRHGEIGKTIIKYLAKYTKFTDLDYIPNEFIEEVPF